MTITDQLTFKRKFNISRYINNQLSVIIHGFSGEPIAELSIMTDSVELAPNEFILKDYSENEYLVQECYDSNLFTPTDRFVLIGSHLCTICQIRSEV
ncbi:MAG: hypothetical protein ACFE75_04385 [Candidatus Hodarchaeota archaeon]